MCGSDPDVVRAAHERSRTGGPAGEERTAKSVGRGTWCEACWAEGGSEGGGLGAVAGAPQHLVARLPLPIRYG